MELCQYLGHKKLNFSPSIAYAERIISYAALRYALIVRISPLEYRDDKETFDYAETLAEPIQRFADVLEKAQIQAKEITMINILLEGFDIDAPWLYDELKNYIQPNHSVAVVAFSFRDNRVKSLSDWNALYSKECGKYHDGIVGGFTTYGIPEENINFINYFTDTKESATQKIKSADIVYFLGGLPDRMMDRIKEFDLYDILMQHDGILMGYSAGAVIQLAEYHLSPDDDYPEFKYYEGLPYLNDFYLEVHYEGTLEQDESIQRVLAERGKTVYATAVRAGAILVDNGNLKLLGDVKVFGR